ncbi:ribose-phosphate diphosphokinase [Babesia gibsoni]|uniref:ribose-phosphate diphosphokinase n=1 Tax=Babesia gibsoni TaxID=33632 RepID=A0AAD8PE99_BABGI|nr:ribose-phosphate diphosphokinase [Babesia gibsoni]
MVHSIKEFPLVFTGNWNKDLVLSACKEAGYCLGKSDVSKFSDGEVKVVLQEHMRGKDVIFVQSTSPPTSDNLVELLYMISAASRAGAKHITAIIPYFGYSRQDRKCLEGSNISASDVARMLELMGVNRVVTFDLHSAMCQGFFGPKVQVDNFFVHHAFLEHLAGLSKVSIVSPDAGAYERAMKFFDIFAAEFPHCDVRSAIVFKQRVAANVIGKAELVGDVDGRDTIIVDDIVDTAGTLCNAADLLFEYGAKSVMAVVTHGILSGPAVDRIKKCRINKLLITDSIKHSDAILSDGKIKVVSLYEEIANILSDIQAT